MTSIGELKRRTLETLTRPSYSLSKKDLILLNDNANLFGTNPAIPAVVESFDFGRLWAYPSESSEELRNAVSSKYGVSPEEVISPPSASSTQGTCSVPPLRHSACTSSTRTST
jgi:histidinol-phosphate/aromatic aminotransferase/cobyric acid decarboxylase-like protein